MAEDCRNDVAGTPVRVEESVPDGELAALCKALGHPARVRILRHLLAQESCHFGDLSSVVDLSPSTVSQHVTVLKEAGLIVGWADERWVCYCVNADRLALLKRLVAAL